VWYQIQQIPDVKDHVVYKLWYNEKYVVIAAKTIQRSVENINIGLKYFFQNTPKGRNPNDLYYKFYCYVADNPFHTFRIEFLLHTDNPYEFLKAEQIALDAAKTDDNCLNKVFDVYIPQFTQVNGKKSWINRGFYLNFMNWKRNKEANLDKPV
jgi:hypothetical protein